METAGSETCLKNMIAVRVRSKLRNWLVSQTMAVQAVVGKQISEELEPFWKSAKRFEKAMKAK